MNTRSRYALYSSNKLFNFYNAVTISASKNVFTSKYPDQRLSFDNWRIYIKQELDRTRIKVSKCH